MRSGYGNTAPRSGNLLVPVMLSRSLSTHRSYDFVPFAPLSVEVAFPDPTTVDVTPAGEADFCSVTELRRALNRAIGAGTSNVVIHLDRLTFMDASALGVLADARRRLSADGRTLRVRCRTRHFRRLLSITGLDCMLDPES